MRQLERKLRKFETRRGIGDNLRQLERNSRQFETTQEELKTIPDNLRGTQLIRDNSRVTVDYLRQLKRKSRQISV